jgi:hypothetical protein
VATSSIEESWIDKKRIMEELFDKVRDVHRETAARGGLQHSMNHVFLELKTSDLVIVKVPTRAGKLAMQFIGPCIVVKKLSDVTYIVRDMRTKRDMRVHVQRLCKFHADSRYGPPYDTHIGTNMEKPITSQGKLYWPDSEQLKEVPFEDHELVILRSNFNQRVVVGEVLVQHHDTNEIEIHMYMHEPDQYSKEEYDAHMPLARRRLAPEYTYYTKTGDLRAVGTFKPNAHWEPETKLFHLSHVEVLARNVTLTEDLRIPQSVLENIQRQYEIF